MKALITNAVQDGGLVAARSLARAGFSVTGADVLRLPRGVRSRYMIGYRDLVDAREREFEDALVGLVESVRPDVFLPIGTRGVLAAARCREALAAMTAVNVVDEPAFMAAFDKSVCVAECHRLGIGCARVLGFEEALAMLERAPGTAAVVVKPPWDVGAARGVCYVREPGALRETVERCSRVYGGSLVQDYIPGGADAMRTVLLLFTPESDVAAAFTMQKIRHWPQTGGATAAGRSTDEPELVELVLPFFRAWRWRGPAEVELKLDPRDGRFKVIEINPRFPGYLRFAWHCGLDLPLLATRLALGDARAVPDDVAPTYRVGQRYVAPTLFARTVRDDVRVHGWGAALRKARTDLRGSAPVILGMLADPVPLVARMLRPTSVPGAAPARPVGAGRWGGSPTPRSPAAR